jgi:hypothetical protein
VLLPTLPFFTTCFGPRTAWAGLKSRIWPTTSQSNSIRSAAKWGTAQEREIYVR